MSNKNYLFAISQLIPAQASRFSPKEMLSDGEALFKSLDALIPQQRNRYLIEDEDEKVLYSNLASSCAFVC
jgi:hypothetical protein